MRGGYVAPVVNGDGPAWKPRPGVQEPVSITQTLRGE